MGGEEEVIGESDKLNCVLQQAGRISQSNSLLLKVKRHSVEWTTGGKERV